MSLDHGILSPSGRVSKRARKLALERVREELFGKGWTYPTVPQPTEREVMLRRAFDLRELAARGMHPIKYKRLANELERQALRPEAARQALKEEGHGTANFQGRGGGASP